MTPIRKKNKSLISVIAALTIPVIPSPTRTGGSRIISHRLIDRFPPSTSLRRCVDGRLYLLGVRGNHSFPQDKYRLNYNLYFYSFPSPYWGRGYDNGANSITKVIINVFIAQVKVDFMSGWQELYIGPMAVFDYIDGRNFEKPNYGKEWLRELTIPSSLGIFLSFYDFP